MSIRGEERSRRAARSPDSAVHSTKICGLKVFMDARMPVTHEEGDRYPLGPPKFSPGSAIGRGNGLRSHTVWVRIPPWAPSRMVEQSTQCLLVSMGMYTN